MLEAAPPTLFALASGAPPAAIAVIRLSGGAAASALEALTGRALPPPRRVALRSLYDPMDGRLLDRALIVFLPGPGSPTGEDVVELHLHGGRAVVAAVSAVLSRLPGLMPAGPGAFTRRAFDNGVMDLTQVEGLADLIDAETEIQRSRALAATQGRLSRQAEDWRLRLIHLSAQVEADLDFSDEEDVGTGDLARIATDALAVAQEMRTLLALPSGERLRDGLRVAFVGPPNSGKSSLVNALAGRDVAIVTPIAGTTRDLIEVPIAIAGLPYLLIDTAGDRDTDDPVEAEGVARARRMAEAADIVVDFTGRLDGRAGQRVIAIHAKSDLVHAGAEERSALAISVVTGEGLNDLVALIAKAGAQILRPEQEAGLANSRQITAVDDAATALEEMRKLGDMVLAAEALRTALTAIGTLTGRVGVEEMLDALFGRFCIGK